MNLKTILKLTFVIFVIFPTLLEAAFPIATGGRKVLVIWNNDVAYDDYIVEGGSGNNMIDILSSAGGVWAGAGFNFTVDQLKVASTFNAGKTWATAGSAIANAVSGGTIQALTAANYCIVFDMRFVNNNAVASGGTQTAGTIAGDTITSGDITAYQNYLSSGAGGLFIMGDNFYTGTCGSGSETGFISREENMNTMINAVATSPFSNYPSSCQIGVGPLINTGDYIVIPSPGAPYALTTNFNAGLPNESSDYSGPVSIANLGSGHAWFQHQSDPWAVGIVWDGASGDLQAAYPTGRMMYWGDSSMISLWATGVADANLPLYLENSVAFLDQDSCCMPPTTTVCGGPDVQLTAGNPTVVACFETNADGWSTGTWDGTQDHDGSGGGSLKGTAGEYSNAVVFQDTFAADTLQAYDTIDFWMRNPNGVSITFDIADALYGTVIAGPFTVPAGGAWTHFTETLGGDFGTTTKIVFENTSAPGIANATVNLDSVRLRFSCSSHLYLRDPACCSVVDTPTPTNTKTSTPTPTNTNTPTITNTHTMTSTSTNTNSPTPSNTNTNTSTPINTPTDTYTLTETPTNTITSTPTPTPTSTNTTTPTLTNTPVPSATATDTPTLTNTNSSTPTPTNTLTPTITNTPVPSATETDTPTLTNTNTSTPTPTNTLTPTITNTPVPSATATDTPTVTNTNSSTATTTNTFSPTITNTPPAPATSTFTSTSTNTLTFTPTSTPTSLLAISKLVSETAAKAGDVLTYSIGVTVAGLSLTSPVITDTLPADMTFVSFGTSPSGTTTSFNSSTDQLMWILPSPLAPGVYTFTYQTQINTFAPANVPLRNGVEITYPGLPTPVSTSIPVTVIGNFTVKINIYNSAGEIVKSIPIESFSSAISNIILSTTNMITSLTGSGSSINILFDGYIIGVWDGTTNADLPVSNGAYTVQVDNISSSGVVTSVSQKAIVNRSLSNVEVDIFNSAGEVVRKLYNVVANSTNSSMTNVTLSTNVFKPSLSAPVSSTGTASYLLIVAQDSAGPVTLLWDGTSDSGSLVTPGEYEVQVHWADGSGTTTDITRTVLVVAGGGINGVALARPNVLSTATTMNTIFDASSVMNAAALKIKIYTVAAELVQSFTVASNMAPWNASGLASGIYIANVEIDNASGGVINSQRLKILVLH